MQITNNQAKIIKYALYERAEEADCTTISSEQITGLADYIHSGTPVLDLSQTEKQIIQEVCEEVITQDPSKERSLGNLLNKLRI
jgi:hypothetical protein